MALLNEREAFLHFFQVGAEELLRVIAHGSPDVMEAEGQKQVGVLMRALSSAARRLAGEMFAAAPPLPSESYRDPLLRSDQPEPR